MRKLLIGLLLISVSFVYAQDAKYAVYFTDKNDNPYSISEPSGFLSERALERRARLGISIDESDLPVNPQYITAVEEMGAKLLNQSKWLNCAVFEISDDLMLDAILALNFVEKSVFVKPAGIASPNQAKDKFLREESIIPVLPVQEKNTLVHTTIYDYGYASNQINMLKGEKLHELGYAGQGMIIAVLDAGFVNADQMPVFDSAWAQGRILGTRDFVNPGNDVFAPGNHSHGSSVLSTIASWSPGLIVGTAPEASYWLIRTEDGPTEYLIEEYNWVCGAEFADSLGADVINSSLGYTEFDDPTMNHTYADMDGKTTAISIGASIAGEKGILVCNSAGNSGNDAWHYIGAPADAEHIITVGAVDKDGLYASFSSVGPTSDGRIKPDIMAQGSGAILASTSLLNDTVYGGYGTSFSSPIAAGLVASLRQAWPQLGVNHFIEVLQKSSSFYQNPDDEYGYGIPDFELALNLAATQNIFNSQSGFKLLSSNPVRDKIHIKIDDGIQGNISCSLSDINGRIIKQSEHNAGNGDFFMNGLNALPSGMYFLSIQTNNTKATFKFVK